MGPRGLAECELECAELVDDCVRNLGRGDVDEQEAISRTGSTADKQQEVDSTADPKVTERPVQQRG